MTVGDQKLSERFVFDDEADIVTIDGYRVVGAGIGMFTRADMNKWFRIISRDDGVITIEQKHEEVL